MAEDGIRQWIAHPSEIRRAGKKALMLRLLEVKEGETFTFEDIEEWSGLKYTLDNTDRGAVMVCLRKMERDYGIIFHNIRGKGFARTRPGEVNGLIDEKTRLTQRKLNKLKKFVNVALTGNYYDRMSQEDKKEVYRKAAAIGALSLGKVFVAKEYQALPQPKQQARDRKIGLPKLAP